MSPGRSPSKERAAKNNARSEPLAADLFCGAGGLSIGFKEAGFKIAFANDIDEQCRDTYLLEHPSTCWLDGSIEDLTAKGVLKTTGLEKGEIDVLIGGPPCQGFSINAPRRNIGDARNHLFKHYARLVLEGLKPKVVLMENVPGMLSLDQGRTVRAIYSMFGEAGYHMKHMILCAAHYGVPQERWRLFFIGTRLPDAEITFPYPTHWAPVRANFTGGRELTWLRHLPRPGESARLFGNDELQKHTSVREAIGDLPPLATTQGQEESPYNGPPSSAYQRSLRANQKQLFNHVAGFLSPQNLARLKHIPPGGSWRDVPFALLPKGMKSARTSDHTRRYGRLNPDGLSGTVLTKCDPHWGTFFHYEQDRALTVREAARIQSFPDRIRFTGGKVAQFAQVGNAVPPILARVLAKHISEHLLS